MKKKQSIQNRYAQPTIHQQILTTSSLCRFHKDQRIAYGKRLCRNFLQAKENFVHHRPVLLSPKLSLFLMPLFSGIPRLFCWWSTLPNSRLVGCHGHVIPRDKMHEWQNDSSTRLIRIIAVTPPCMTFQTRGRESVQDMKRVCRE